MTEQNQENRDTQYVIPPSSAAKRRNTQYDNELGAAGKSLSEALRISFVILKIIMIVLVILFFASGLKTVGSDEQALVLRFGRIRGVGEERLLGPGLHWVFPYPIDNIVRIPVAKKVNLPLSSFWYFQTEQEKLGKSTTQTTYVPPTLNPVKDGYCITRGEKQNQTMSGSGGSDYNIVHSKSQLTYQISDPERFFINVYVEDVKPGQLYFDVITKSIEPLLKNMLEDAIVTTMADYTIDEAMFERVAALTDGVKNLLQKRLTQIESGITVVSVQLTSITWPRQVDEAFLASIKASQNSQKAISEARTDAEKTLNEAAGPVARRLFAALRDKKISDQEKDLLWSQAAGQAQATIAEARAYRTSIVETARADAEYLLKLLPEYRKLPDLVIQRIYQKAIEYVLDNAVEKIVIRPTEGNKPVEVRIMVSGNKTIKQKSKKD